jgi:hypothetical protein
MCQLTGHLHLLFKIRCRFDQRNFLTSSLDFLYQQAKQCGPSSSPHTEWTSRAGKSEGFFSKGSQKNPHRVCVAPDLSANAEH